MMLGGSSVEKITRSLRTIVERLEAHRAEQTKAAESAGELQQLLEQKRQGFLKEASAAARVSQKLSALIDES